MWFGRGVPLSAVFLPRVFPCFPIQTHLGPFPVCNAVSYLAVFSCHSLLLSVKGSLSGHCFIVFFQGGAVLPALSIDYLCLRFKPLSFFPCKYALLFWCSFLQDAFFLRTEVVLVIPGLLGPHQAPPFGNFFYGLCLRLSTSTPPPPPPHAHHRFLQGVPFTT